MDKPLLIETIKRRLAYIAEAQRLYGEYVFDSILSKLNSYERRHP